MRTSTWRMATALVAVTAIIGSAPAGAAVGRSEQGQTPGVQGDPQGTTAFTDKDNRKGRVAPSARQRSLVTSSRAATRWNSFGTPAALTPTRSGVLASGLSRNPETAARQYLGRNRDLFGLAKPAVAALETVGTRRIGNGTVVLMRQRFGNLVAAHDGLVAVAVRAGAVVHVSSSLSRDTRAPAPPMLSAQAALAAAARDAGIAQDRIGTRRVRLVALPSPAEGPRAAYEVVLFSTDVNLPTAYTTYVDARTGEVLVRENLVDFDSDNPRWAAFPATPPADYSSTDTRQTWCFTAVTGCVRQVRDPATGGAWDVDAATGAPTSTTKGNSVSDVQNWGGPFPPAPATPRPDRTYDYPWTNQWFAQKCDPTTLESAQHNDIDAATANLFAMHNRMHDWSYRLGFTEETWNLQAVNAEPAGKGGDAEQGRSQQGASNPAIRNNANQATPPDGLMPVTNMYLWQPVAGAAYPPCVDGDYDMTVIGHEYTHAISNRMIAGPDAGIQSFQGGAMGESWSDLVAMEYLYEYGFRSPGNTPYVIGGYVTGDRESGIRNYDMSASPLNYSDVGYDIVGPQVHADGEIWSATNFAIRQALVARYGSGTRALQESCAEGATPVAQCPGNRRWIQLVFDSFLLQASPSFSMLDMRDNMLTADALRFDGANQDLLWNAFAARGMGAGASSGPDDDETVPSFASPMADNATVTFRPLGDGKGQPVRFYVGGYEARATPIADTDPTTPLPDSAVLAPGSYDFLAVGAGLGHKRFTQFVRAGATQVLPVLLTANLASAAAGATVSGDGVNLDKLVDDSEATNWASRGGVSGRQVTVDLAGSQPTLVSRIQVSALLRPPAPGPDPATQNRFSALRSFEVLACNAAVADCSKDESYKVAYTSPANAFPGGAFRPKAPQLALRSFTIRPTIATHLRLRVVQSQCTGNPQYAGEQDNDPRSNTDCATTSMFANEVRAAELQAFAF